MNWIDQRKWPNYGPEYTALDGTVYFWCRACEKWHVDPDVTKMRAEGRECGAGKE